jgi:hypothetical protein
MRQQEIDKEVSERKAIDDEEARLEAAGTHVWTCVCMYVYMYVCIYVCMHMCVHVCMYACMHVCMYACIWSRVIQR